ncbi:winged helix-turn-helix domain-containing protein [Kitasatospora sp. NPDC059088]|uniref:winged helix-turn-helix domain-containing protein n=1 Tax=Kitasatospora sp. NPDC059088 TaxID=3346722 RepID=UPI0036C5070D
MIPAGTIPADDKKAAELYGLSLSRYRTVQPWKKFPPSVKYLQSPAAKVRIHDLEQLKVQISNMKLEEGAKQEIPLLSRDPDILLPQKAGEVPQLKPGVRLQGDDLLDRYEAYAAIPEKDRPAWSTWLRLIAPPSGGAKTVGPEPDDEFDIAGARLWRYRTLMDWNNNRTPQHATGHGHGRPVGREEPGTRQPRRDFIERVDKTRQLLSDNPGLTKAELAQALGGKSERTVERILAFLEEEHAGGRQPEN